MRNAFFVLSAFFVCTAASADMIEIKGRGILNGTIVSQDENQVQFKDTANNVFTVPKTDVLFLESQKDVPSPPDAALETGFDWKDLSSRWGGRLRGLWRDICGRFKGVTAHSGSAASASPAAPHAKGRPSAAQAYDIRTDWDIKKERESSAHFVRPPDSAPMLDNSGRRIRRPKYTVDQEAAFSLEG